MAVSALILPSVADQEYEMLVPADSDATEFFEEICRLNPDAHLESTQGKRSFK